MAHEKKGRKDRADDLHAVIDRLTAAPAADSPPIAPKGPGGMSLREAIHRRMQELDASEGDSPRTEQPVQPVKPVKPVKPDDETS
ncbi:hypothetical protein [Streptomyces sp. NPDC001530]|uniref:hypothetical protein n=1 Tax=Streptomyces sp. NPDC001530 TaxID=3364582 RepID=UPI0036AAD7C6